MPERDDATTEGPAEGTALPWASPPPLTDEQSHELSDVTLPGAGASSLGGALTPGSFGRVLMSLFALSRTGRLAIETGLPGDAGGVRGTLFLLHGEPVHAGRAEGDALLLARLRASGLAEDATVDPSRPLVPLLVRRRQAEPTAILHALRDELREMIAGALAAEIGVYRFFEDVDFAEHVPIIGVNPFGILLERHKKSLPSSAIGEATERIGALFPLPGAGFTDVTPRLTAFTGGADLGARVDGTQSVRAVCAAAGIDPAAGALVFDALAEAGLLTLESGAAPTPRVVERRPSTSAYPIVSPTDGITLLGAELPGGGDLLTLYLLLKPERDDQAILGVSTDAPGIEVERAFRARMVQLDPSAIAGGRTRPHLLARFEELRQKIERAYHARLATLPIERIHEFDLGDKLGEGGMAEVFIGWPAGDPSRPVAIKRIIAKYRADDRFARMFLREARLTRRIEHKNVVRVLSVGKAGDDLYLAMEFVDGADLGRLLGKSASVKRWVPIETACRIIADACGGLHAAHTAHDASGLVRPILHRDVSPQNILVAHDGAVKLTDFGVAKAVGSLTESLDRTGFIKGKVGYLAPELIDGFSASVRTDVYAMAITLYASLAKLPFRKPDLLQTMRAIITEPVPPLSTYRPDCPPRLDDILARAMAKDPEVRPQSAQQLQLELEHVLLDLPPPDVGKWVEYILLLDAPSSAPPRAHRTGTTRVPIVEAVEDVDVADL